LTPEATRGILRASMRPLRTALAAFGVALAASLAAAGCTNACQEVGDRVCNCLPVGSARNTCQTNVKNQINAARPSSAQTSYCSSLLNTCPDPGTSWTPDAPPAVCALLDTCQGKINCGLALPPPGGLDGGCEVPVSPLPDGGP